VSAHGDKIRLLKKKPADGEKSSAQRESCASISTEEARTRQLEAIERQLHYLIGQVRQLKKT
jgi:hypothetical protein